jgi:rhodanese-related sulfurtransferase
VNVEQTHALMGEPLTTIVDVRDFNEFDTGRVPGSHHCPLEHLDEWVAQQPLPARLVVVCAAGVRSAYAAEYLRSRGFDAVTMTGGVGAWRTAGLPWDTSPVRT